MAPSHRETWPEPGGDAPFRAHSTGHATALPTMNWPFHAPPLTPHPAAALQENEVALSSSSAGPMLTFFFLALLDISLSMGWDQRGTELRSGPSMTCIWQTGGFLLFKKKKKGQRKNRKGVSCQRSL